MISTHGSEVFEGTRFRFGENWSRFLSVLSEDRISAAEASLRAMLDVERLDGQSFVDVGSGSGLFSLAARRMGAKVISFDFDPSSVACTRELKRRYFPDCPSWSVMEASVLDQDFLAGLGQFDVVYSWGVLHHTGAMWTAMANVVSLVRPEGQLFIAIYNDQGYLSKRWLKIKRFYCSGAWGRFAVRAVCIPYFVLPPLLLDLVKLRNPMRLYLDYKKERGMSKVHDWYDWLGGYPFEVARPEAIYDFYRVRGFDMEKMTTCGGGLGCNQFVFRRASAISKASRER